MRISKGKSRIVAIQLGEAELNFLLPGKPPLRGKFAFVNEEGAPCGSTETLMGWSDKTVELLRQLAASMEKDVEMAYFHKSETEEVSDTPEEEPAKKDEGVPQF